jgi:hypothetical protein
MGNQTTDRIRQAVSSGEFQRATLLWNEYAAWVREEIARGRFTQAQMAEAADLVEWSRGVVECDRAHAQAQLATLWVASRYGPAYSPSNSCFRASL